MKHAAQQATAPVPRSSQSGNTRTLVGMIVALAAGLLVGAFWGQRQRPQDLSAARPANRELSVASRAILQGLETPVEIRFYSPSALSDLPEPLAVFAVRVKELLSQYEGEAGGKIELRPMDPLAEAASKANAGADGMLPFAGRDGAVCYLGITVIQAERKQTLPQLAPQWESALEADLSRAIARVGASPVAPTVASRPTSSTPIDPAITEEVLRSVPDLESRSFEEAAKILREAALTEFTAQANEMQSKVGAAQGQVLAAQARNSEREQQAAVKELQRTQAEQTEKLKGITARLQARIAALEHLKGIRPSSK
jgi:hypothetical protein